MLRSAGAAGRRARGSALLARRAGARRRGGRAPVLRRRRESCRSGVGASPAGGVLASGGVSVDRFLERLRRAPGGAVFNPWYSRDAGTDREADAAAARRERLRAHLDCGATLVLVGEAAGYQGCHVTGMAFTSERLILAGSIPRIVADGRLSTRERPWSEPSATTVRGTLHTLGLAARTVLWNCFPWHPHR